MERIYLDNNSTTKVDESVLEVMLPYFCEKFGNASSIHSIGQENKRAIEKARESMAKVLGVKAGELLFTAGGSESNNLAIIGAARKNSGKGKHIITSVIEHPSVLNTCKALEKEGYEVSYISVDEKGILKLEELKKTVRKDTILITVMHGNNEIGTMQPIEEIGLIAKENKILFHVDAVQTVGKLEVKPKEMNIDLLSFSGHKFYGPKGIGALYIRNGVKLDKVLHGGHQERNRRPGTENVPGIVGMAKALEIANEDLKAEYEKELKLRNKLEKGLVTKIPEVIVNGHKEKRLPGTLSLTIKFVEGESILLNLDLKGIAVSSGSACTSGSLEPSHVVLATGVPVEFAHGTIRFSVGRFNTEKEIDYVIETLPEIVEKIRAMSPFWNNN